MTRALYCKSACMNMKVELYWTSTPPPSESINIIIVLHLHLETNSAGTLYDVVDNYQRTPRQPKKKRRNGCIDIVQVCLETKLMDHINFGSKQDCIIKHAPYQVN